MDLGLAGRVALVTGAARGLGRSDAVRLASEGCRVALWDLDEAGAKETEALIRAAGGEALAAQVDIVDAAAVTAEVSRIAERWKAVDVAVNNAAVLDNVGQFYKMDEARWRRDLEVNVTGTFHVCRAVWAGMKAQSFGRIINMSSVAGTLGGFGQAGYATSKAGLIGLTKTLALEGARYGITANAIVPGVIRTEGYALVADDMKERINRRTAFGRPGEPDDVAGLIAFLASTWAGYLTGQAITVGGGIDLFTF